MKSAAFIDAIENIRTKNNSVWMEILRIAARYAPTETADLLAQVRANDENITKITAHLEHALRTEAIDVLHD